ncbi:hypothetical protein NUW58_g5590 [Xylaria curta]|uniref:Uncharacterized protein n=1 Tax=Xylaria curta TaxID=42375 RepID=A0ACC1P1N2_9PEZI|nr:hypothetical protein NUW58_g5590 [Xylaria curta]
MHPAAGLPLERIVPEPGMEIAGRYVKGGTIIFGDDVDVYRPERWLVDETLPEPQKEDRERRIREMNGHMFQFGMGARTCIGKNISLLEMYKLVPSLLRRSRRALLTVHVTQIRFKDPSQDWKTVNAWFIKQQNFQALFERRELVLPEGQGEVKTHIMEAISRWLAEHEAVRKVGGRAWRVFETGWHLGFTSFGGPAVHFKIFQDKYIDKLGWIDEQTLGSDHYEIGHVQYQELFSLSQALSGPASTKMLYCINLICEGFIPAVLGFLLWSLPGAFGMLGLCIGVSNIGETLPRAVYALLSGLNASTVGVIALAAVQLSQKAITDKLTRIIVFLGASAGLLYNALWYFPILVVAGGIATVVFDARWLHPPVRYVLGRLRRRQRAREAEEALQIREISGNETTAASTVRNRSGTASPQTERESPSRALHLDERDEPRVIPAHRQLNMSWKVGLLVISLFIVSFVIIIVLRGTLETRPLLFNLFANLYLAGTIIFGGGPVVIPLLREYIIAEGWVSPRDFLIGLAVIQAFPGPNFNFAVYLGGLTAANAGMNAGAGAIIGFIGIFAPGMILCHGTMGIWAALRSTPIVKSALRGINAAAVGLIYTAVYRLWQIGYIDEGFTQGTSLANDPWWVVVTATSYVGSSWFGLSPPIAIALGAILGLIRYGVVG